MTWWTWMILGALLLGAELLAVDAQFYLVFLGISAALVGLAGLFGLASPEWMQWVAFAVLALVFMLTFRRSLYEKIRGGGDSFPETMSGESVKVTSDIAPGADVRLEFRGSEWTVLNVGDAEIARGTRAVIVNVDGLTLHISADQPEVLK
jgi:membrane protein implicated in regulation of membrane protease activity